MLKLLLAKFGVKWTSQWIKQVKSDFSDFPAENANEAASGILCGKNNYSFSVFFKSFYVRREQRQQKTAAGFFSKDPSVHPRTIEIEGQILLHLRIHQHNYSKTRLVKKMAILRT